MKRVNIFSILTTIFLVAAVLSPIQAAADPAVKKTYQLSLASIMPIDHLITKSGDFYVRRVAELSGGKIKIKHYPSDTLFDQKAIPEAVMSGGCSMAINTSSRWAGYAPSNHFWETPFLLSNKAQIDKVADAVIPIIDEELYPKGAKLLGFVYYGDADMIGNSKRPVYKPEDLKGLKMRSFSILLSSALQSIGGTPVVMSSAEVYTAIQRGTIDGAISGSSTFVSRKWMEALTHITLVRGMVSYPALPFTIAINRDIWENMEPSAQKILLQAANETWKFSNSEVIEETDAAMKVLKARGNLKIHTIDFGSKEWKYWKDIMSGPAKAKYLEIGGRNAPKILEIIKQNE